MIILGAQKYIFNLHAKFYTQVPIAAGSKITRKKMVFEFNCPLLDVMVQEIAEYFKGYPFITKDGWFIYHAPVRAKLQEIAKAMPEALINMDRLEVDGRYAVDINIYRNNVDGTPSIGTDIEPED